MSDILNLQPKLIWKYFHEITQIPRPSKKEEKIRQYLINFANAHGLKVKTDEIGNILITKTATAGKENCTAIVLQSHIDMVCEKNPDSTHNFDTDAIETHIEDDWVKANGTTLGADNGIGMAAQLAVLADKSLKHGIVECLFTVDEETGLTGAFALKADFFTAKTLINLDSEDDGELFIGCSGGVDTIIEFELNKEVVAEAHGLKIEIGGLLGGHSGDDINKGRVNANKLLARILYHLKTKCSFNLCTITGGNLSNAIPRNAQATISSHGDIMPDVQHIIEIIKNEIASDETNVNIIISNANVNSGYSSENSAKIIDALYFAPNGIIDMNASVPGLVETSTNLASIKEKDEKLMIVTSQRSASVTKRDEIAFLISQLFINYGGKANHEGYYPGWKPNTNSEILKKTKAIYEQLFNEEPIIRAIHAGLECGLFLEKYPYLDMISFGPTIRDAHSPDEKLSISAVEKFWKLLVAVLEQ